MKTVLIKMENDTLFSHESASMLAHAMSRFECSIMIHDQNRLVNAKSLLGILSLGYIISPELEFVVDGEDETEACESIKRYFQSENKPL